MMPMMMTPTMMMPMPNNDGQSMIVQGSLVDKPNEPKTMGARQFKHALCNGNLRYQYAACYIGIAIVFGTCRCVLSLDKEERKEQ